MRITCGTEFSERSYEAAEVAALLAARSGGRMELVHALDVRGAVFGAAHVLQTLETAARERLDAEVERLRALGATVDAALPDGWPDEALLGEAARHQSTLLVLGATGSRDGPGVSVGKTCERTLGRTTLPMLVVREAAPLLAWLRGERPLNIMVGFDFTVQSASALAFAARLAGIGSCRILAAYTDDAKREASRMGLLDAPDEARRRLYDALVERVAQLEPELPAEVVVSPHLGDPASRLAHLAEREAIDLIVTGTNQRRPLQRLFAGSVSLQLLREAPTNVLVVPTPPEAVAAAAVSAPSEVRRLLVATDLSDTGNRAVAHAIAIAPPGCEITVINVMNPNQMLDGAFGRPSYAEFEAEHAQERARREKALQDLMPAPERLRQRTLRFEVVEHDLPAKAIVEQAQKHDVDLLCMGTLGRSGLSAALLGSSAQQVLTAWKGPPLLIPPAGQV